MKLGFIVESRYLRQSMPGKIIDVMVAKGIDVDIINPNHGFLDVNTKRFLDATGSRFQLQSYNATISRNRNPLGLALLAFVEREGIVTINNHSAIQQVRNKATMAIALNLAGIPTVHTFLADDVGALTAHVEGHYPIVVKATYGEYCQGLVQIHRSEDLVDMQWGNELALAQHYLPNDGYDLQLNVVGRQVIPVRKPSPFNRDINAVARRVDLDERIADIALRCGDLFGLNLYSVDTIESPEGPVVIDVNDFPNYTGIPGIGQCIAEYILNKISESGV